MYQQDAVSESDVLLCVERQAENDPIAPAKAIPKQAMRDNPNCILVVTPCGGHLGWVSGPEAPLGRTPPPFSSYTFVLSVMFTEACAGVLSFNLDVIH